MENSDNNVDKLIIYMPDGSERPKSKAKFTMGFLADFGKSNDKSLGCLGTWATYPDERWGNGRK